MNRESPQGVMVKVLDCSLQVVIYEDLYFDLAQGQMNGALNETAASK